MKFSCFAGEKIFLFGLGGSGLAAAQALAAGGAELTVWDDRREAAEQAEAEGLKAADWRKADWRGVKALILAPGVPLTHPEPHWSAKLAQQAGIEIIGDIELFFRERALQTSHAPIIAVSGTNGKSTTTALIAHILAKAGFAVETGGNIGKPVAELAPFSRAGKQIYVLEISSYQIDLTPSLKPTIGIILNITPDHIDRHGSFAHYAAVKERLAAQAETAIIGADAPCREIYARLKIAGKQIIPLLAADKDFAAAAEQEKTAGFNFYFAVNGQLFRKSGQKFLPDKVLLDLAEIPVLRGRHNWQNALAAINACAALGAAEEKILAGLQSFQGLPHRLQEAARLTVAGGTLIFINDSKATNAEAAAPALSAFNKPNQDIYWLAGGRAKTGGIENLSGLDGVEKAYLIGEAAAEFARIIAPRAFKGCKISETLTNAFCDAVKDAEMALKKLHLQGGKPREAVVLLSPACASFDQFKNFEQRGEVFTKLAQDYCRHHRAEKA